MMQGAAQAHHMLVKPSHRKMENQIGLSYIGKATGRGR